MSERKLKPSGTFLDVIYDVCLYELEHKTWGNDSDGYTTLHDLLTPDSEKTISTGIQNVKDLADGIAVEVFEKVEPIIEQKERLKEINADLLEALTLLWAWATNKPDVRLEFLTDENIGSIVKKAISKAEGK